MASNPIQFINMLRRSKNPEQFVINILESQGGNNNPVVSNLISMAKRGDQAGIEQVARNILAEQGYDFDKEFGNFRDRFGL